MTNLEVMPVKSKARIAAVLLYLVAVCLGCVGLMYLFSPTIMPYHEAFLGKTHQQLDPRVAELFLFMMRGAGAIFVSVGLGLTLLVRCLFTDGAIWAWWAILVMGLGSLLPMLFITLSIGRQTPWWAVATILILMGSALAMSRQVVTR